MSAELEKIADHFCPKGSDEDHPFPNHTDSDIWKAGFVKGVEISTRTIIGEFSLTTQAWLLLGIKSIFKLK